MTPLAITFLAFVCSIFGTTSETAKNGQHIIPDEIYEDDIFQNNLKLAHLYGNFKFNDIEISYNDKEDHNKVKGWRHYNVDSKINNENDKHLNPVKSHKVERHGTDFNKYDETKANKLLKAVDERMRHFNNDRSKRETYADPCKPFTFVPGKTDRLTHPKDLKDLSRPGEGVYLSNTTCFTNIKAADGEVIVLTFVDVFQIEQSSECKNDYLEIRNGRFGYAIPAYKFCGKTFPPTITSTGPYMWLKFRSDETIEYAGFSIDIKFVPQPTSKAIPDSCYKSVGGISGTIDGTSTSEDLTSCREQLSSAALDVQWKIETDPGTQIYLNITQFQLVDVNNCSKNTLQIFGSKPNFDHLLGEYCSSVAKSLWTEEGKKFNPGPANIMYVRLFTTDRRSNFSAIYTKFRTADDCDVAAEFDCKDGTCIDKTLKCDSTAHCRLKADKDPAECKGEVQLLVQDEGTRYILIVFSLILSAMISVFLFKCIRKLYEDQKQINTANQLLLKMDQKSRTSKATPETGSHSSEQNLANETSRHLLHLESSSPESDQRISVGDWPEDEPILAQDIRLPSGRPRDLSGKEDLLRGKSSKEDRMGRDVSVGMQDVQEAECQTRESLYQTEPIVPRTSVPVSKSVSISASGATSPAHTPQLTVELLRQATAQDTSSSQAEGRPLSSETTKSAPDVIQIY